MAELFQTQRDRLVTVYQKAGQPFLATTKPYKSTRPLVFTVKEAKPAGAATMAHLVAAAGQQLLLFGFGVGDAIQDGFGNTFQAADDDTNQADANNTTGASDFVIEGVSASAKGVRIKYPLTTATTTGGIVDPDVIAAYESSAGAGATASEAYMPDPAALATPPQLSSPFNLEQALFSAVAPILAVQFVFDRERTEKIGTLDEIPEGGGKSFLKANGDPRTDNRYRIPEGYLWRRAGEPDSNFNIILTLLKPVVIPITLVGLFGATQSPLVIPQKVALDITMRVHGLNVRIPSQN